MENQIDSKTNNLETSISESAYTIDDNNSSVLHPTSSSVSSSQELNPIPNTQKTYTYAGFWLRFLAHIIDSLIIFVAFFIIFNFISVINISNYFNSNFTNSYGRNRNISHVMLNSDNFLLIVFITLILQIILIICFYIYYAAFESSSWQATPGKKVLGMIVTDEVENRITFLRALGRNVSKILSSLIFYVGYIMAAFTPRKQSLHDIIARTLVLKKV